MNPIGELIQQLSRLLGSQGASRRILVLGVLVASVVGMYYLATHATTGSYKTLFTNLQVSEAAEAAGKLRSLDIPVRLADGGTTLEVTTSKWDQALILLSQEGFPDSGVLGYRDLMDKSSIGLSDFEQKLRHHRALEGELARTIMTIREVERARVHLALPKPSLFLSESAKPTASVVLRLRSGSRLTADQMIGLTNLVAHSVDGLDAQLVTIVDDHGRMLSSGTSPGEGAAISDRAGYKTEYENRLKERIERMLARTVGEGKVAASVNADFDFAHRTVSEVNYDPDSAVARRENWSGEGPGAASAVVSSGAPGSASNLPPGSSGGPLGQAGSESGAKADRETLYEISQTTSQVVETVPILQRLTVSVLVDGTYREVDDGSGNMVREFEPRSAADLQTFEESVKNIIGYSEDRGDGEPDAVSVKSVPFQFQETDFGDEPPAVPFLAPELIEEIVRWGVVCLVGLVLIFTVLRPAVRSISIVTSPAPAALPAGGAAMSRPALGERSLETASSESPQALGEGSAPRGLPESQSLPPVIERTSVEAERQNQLQQELNEQTNKDVPKAAGVLRQWIDSLEAE